MRITVFAVLIISWGISQSYGQLSATLISQENQTVCLGQSISHHCTGDGNGMLLYSPPTVNETDAFSFFSGDDDFLVSRNRLAVAFALVDPARNSSINGTLVQFTSSEGEYRVFCQVFNQNSSITSSANFSAIGRPTPADNLTHGCHNYQCKAVQDEGTEEVLVHFSWVQTKNAQEYSLQLNNDVTGFAKTTQSLENSVTLLLPYGDYNATLCVINRCGKACSNHSVFIPRPKPQLEKTAPTFAGGIGVGIGIAIGVFIIGAVIGGIVVSVVRANKKSKKPNHQNVINLSEEGVDTKKF